MSGVYNTFVYARLGDYVLDCNDTEHMVNLNVVRQVDNCCFNFTMEVFDETALELEAAIVSKQMKNREMILQYGYSEDESMRSLKYRCVVTKVTPRFDTTGEMLTIEGTAYDEYEEYTKGGGKTYFGRPDEIVRQIAEENNWRVVRCRETQELPSDGNSASVDKWSVYKPGEMTPHQFIEQKLIPVSKSMLGRGDYRLILEPREEQTFMWFQPAEELDCLEQYTFDVGVPDTDVISFTPSYNYLTTLMGASGVEIVTIDSKTNERISVTVAGEEVSDEKPIHIGTNHASLEAITAAAQNIYQSSANQGYPATLVIKGNPLIKAGHYCTVNVVTSKGHIHPTSGTYWINNVEDLVDRGSFTSTLALTKINIGNGMRTTVNGASPVSQIASNSTLSSRSSGFVGTYKPGEEIGVFEMTAYCPCQVCCGQWSYEVTGHMNSTGLTGDIPSEGRTIAVDPSVIPAGSMVYWEDPVLGTVVRRAEDCGGGIKGNRIDVYFSDHQSALNYGRRHGITVYYAQQSSASSKGDVTIPGDVPDSYILEAVKPYLGIPYVYGGKYLDKSGGLDCSGFAGTIMNQLGGSPTIDLSYWGSNKQSLHGTEVASISDAKPGDLFFVGSGPGSTSHVTIYLGGNYVAHAPQEGDVIKISKIWFTPCCIRRYLQ